ncbi:MAG: hypothetical protein L0228_18380 [Planctomycetes bacterium]|nr:hypothetical protein [Planctomycetota bacterium]
MLRAPLQNALAAGGWTWLPIWLAAISPGVALAAPYVEFDFARTAECRDVTPSERLTQYPNQRLVEFTLPISVRFREVPLNDVDELTVEISGAAAGMRVFDFAPATQLTSDIANPIETTTTTKTARSLDGSLGGALPIPYAAEVAHVTPSINAGISSGETTTEKLNRLPPKHAVVISGTSSEGRGVFFKLKRSSQTSLEGVHELAVTFIVPAGWRGGDVHVECSAGGQRKLLFLKQSAMLGSEGDAVRLYLAGRGTVRRVAKPVVADAAPSWRPQRGPETTATEVAEMVKAVSPEAVKRDAVEVEKVKTSGGD